MRIAMITGEYPPHQGGIGDYTLALSQAMQDTGHDVRVFTAINDAELSKQIPQSVPVANLTQSWRILDVPHIVRAIQKFAPDIVNIQYEPAAYSMHLGVFALPRQLQKAGIPTVITWHDILPPYLFPKAGQLREQIVERLALQARGNIFTNTHDRYALSQRCETRGSLNLTTVIPIGSNIAVAPPADFEPTTWRGQQGYSPDAAIIGFFGFRNRAKGLEHLIDALAVLRQQGIDAHLLFIGGETGTSDPSNLAYAEEINTRIAGHQLQPYINATGFVSQAEVSAALLGIDICALPYLEGANLRHGTLHAALAHGCAIITTTAPDGDSALTDEQCLLIEPGNIQALVTAITTLIKKPEKRQSINSQAQAFSEQFRWPAIAERTVAFYGYALNKHT